MSLWSGAQHTNKLEMSNTSIFDLPPSPNGQVPAFVLFFCLQHSFISGTFSSSCSSIFFLASKHQEYVAPGPGLGPEILRGRCTPLSSPPPPAPHRAAR